MERNIKLLAPFNFFTDLKFHSAILILYFVKITGSFALGMSLFSVAQLSAAFFEIPTGIYSDYLGRKKTLLCGAFFAVLSAIFYAIGLNYWFLFVGALLEGLSRSWYSGNNDALLHESLNSLGRKNFFDHYYGRISSMFQIALAIGAAVGSVIAAWSFALVMWLSVFPQMICFVLGLGIAEPTRETKGSGNIFSHLKFSAIFLWKNKILRLLSLQDIMAYGINEATFDFRSAFLATLWPIWAIGISKMLSFLGGTVSFLYASKVIRKFGAFKSMFISRIYGRLINFTSYLFPNVFSPLLITTTSLNYGVIDVATTSLMQKEFTDRERATISSLNSLLGSIFFGIFSLGLGFLADKINPTHALIVAEICTIPIIYLNWKLFRTKRENV